MELSAALATEVGVAVEIDFDDFYRREWPGLVRLAVTLTGDSGVAEELVQEAMVRVLARWSRIAGYDKPGAYARRVLLNLASSARRRRRAESRALQRTGQPDELTWSRSTAEFWSLVRTLPERQAHVVALYYADDRSTAEIAGVLGIAEGTVRSTLAQARDAVRDRLESEA